MDFLWFTALRKLLCKHKKERKKLTVELFVVVVCCCWRDGRNIHTQEKSIFCYKNVIVPEASEICPFLCEMVGCWSCVIWLLVICCRQEIDCIVNQMMSVAEYLGWDVSELKPVSVNVSVGVSLVARGVHVVVCLSCTL